MFQNYFYKPIVYMPVILIALWTVYGFLMLFSGSLFIPFLCAIAVWLSFKLLDQSIKIETDPNYFDF